MIILLCGQPASGKTTLAELMHNYLRKDSYWASNPIMIDGDRWRDVTQNKDYSQEGRMRNLKGAYDMALYLEKEGFTPICSLVSPYHELREYLRSKASKLALIYLYYEGDRGRNERFVADFDEPTDNCLIINTSNQSVDDSMFNIYTYLKDLIRWETRDGIKKSM